MLSGKFLVTVFAVALAVLAVCNTGASVVTKPVVEGFWGDIQFGTRTMPMAKLPNGQTTAISGNYLDPNALGSSKFVSTPSFQSMLSPRFSNLNYGADIKYNLPDRSNMAVPCDPLTFGDMAQEKFIADQRNNIRKPVENYSNRTENYCSSCGSGSCGNGCPPSCGKGSYGIGHKLAGGYELPADYHSGNWQEVRNSLAPTGENVGSTLPVGTMSTVNSMGEPDQIVVMNQLMYSSRPTSRLYAQGDKIRGDLAITPCQSGWFSVYPNIATDVVGGAMKVLNGEGESNNATLSMLASASGRSTFSGVDLAETLPKYNANMATQTLSNLSANLSDVMVTTFP